MKYQLEINTQITLLHLICRLVLVRAFFVNRTHFLVHGRPIRVGLGHVELVDPVVDSHLQALVVSCLAAGHSGARQLARPLL